jgi:hypothetical protein
MKSRRLPQLPLVSAVRRVLVEDSIRTSALLQLRLPSLRLHVCSLGLCEKSHCLYPHLHTVASSTRDVNCLTNWLEGLVVTIQNERISFEQNTCIFLRIADLARWLRCDCDVETKRVAKALAEVQFGGQGRVASESQVKSADARVSNMSQMFSHIQLSQVHLVALSNAIFLMSPATACA